MKLSVSVRILVFIVSLSLNINGHLFGAEPTDTILVGHNVDSLNYRAEKFLNSNYSEAEKLATLALNLAAANNYSKGEISSICILSAVQAGTNRCRAALIALNKILPVASKINDPESLALVYSAKATCFYSMSAYDSSKYFYESAIKILKDSEDTGLLSAEYLKLARVYIKTGETSKAESYYSKARVIQIEKSSESTARALDVSGEIFQAQRLFDKTLQVCGQSLKLFSEAGNIQGMASASLHKGNAFYMLIKDDSARYYYNRALVNYTELGDSNGIAICYSNISRIFLEGGNFSKAIEYANRSIATIHGGDNKVIETATLQQLGDIYSELGQYDKAIIYINKALVIAQQINHKVTIMDCYKSLSEIYSADHKPDLSYTNLLLAYRLKDSIQPIAFSQQLAKMQDQFETQKKENQIKQLKQNNRIKSFEISEQESQIRMRNYFIFLGIFVFALIAILVYFIRQKQTLKNALEKEMAIKLTEESERMRFARDVHDDLGSGLSKISFLSELMVIHKSLNPEIKDNAHAISETSKSLIDNMRDLIWALNPENTTLDNLLASIREYSSDYLEEYSATVILNFPDKIDGLTISKECHREIFLTVKECLNNIVKHSRATTIEIDASIYSNLLFISMKDDGIGIDATQNKKGNGLLNMKSRIESIGGIFTLESCGVKGTLVSVTIGLDRLFKTKKKQE